MRAIRIRLMLGIVLATTFSACALYKPGRVLSPQVFGLTCVSPTICLDDPTRLTEAEALQKNAFAFVQNKFDPFKKRPRVLFCSTEECFRKFGNPQIAAQNVGTWGVVINDKGWNDHILRHELIHHWQNEHFGTLAASLTLPRWFIEGMAYSLSDDPRFPLPRPEIEQFRAEFDAWVAAGNDWREPPT